MLCPGMLASAQTPPHLMVTVCAASGPGMALSAYVCHVFVWARGVSRCGVPFAMNVLCCRVLL
jgi:hypothetical protein